MKKVMVAVACLWGMVASWAMAQQREPQQREGGLIMVWNDTLPGGYEELTALFYDHHHRHFQDPRAPRFLLIDRKGRVALGIGGYVKVTASCDFAGAIPNRDFVTYDIPVPRHPAERSQFQMDASTSRLFLKLVGNRGVLGKYEVYVEGGFREGDAGGFRLRQAYVSAWGFLIGQARSTFTDPASAPPTIDFEGPSGQTGTRRVMVRYTYQPHERWQLALAAEMPTATYTLREGDDQAIRQRMPDIPLYLQYAWRDGLDHVRVSALLRGLSYRNLRAAKNEMRLGWAVQLSGVAQLMPALTLYYQGVYGQGYEAYLNDLGGKGFDLVADPSTPGRLYAPEALGYVVGLKCAVTRRCFMSAAYSQCRLYPRQGTLSPATYRYSQYVVGNAMYQLTADCNIGIEYLYGHRSNQDGVSGSANRLQAMIQYNF